MPPDLEGFVDEAPPNGLAVERMKALSPGAKVVLVGGVLLFFSLFLTWQNLEIDYGRTGTGTQMLDGWDVWGLLVAFLTLGLLTLVVVVKASDLEVSPDIAWELVAVGLSVALLGLVVVKNLTDVDSAWPSYLGVVLAAMVVAGACLDWSHARSEERGALRRRRRRIRSAV